MGVQQQGHRFISHSSLESKWTTDVAAEMPLLRSEPEEVNVASGVVAMGRSGVAAAACAQAECLRYLGRKFPSMLSIILVRVNLPPGL